MARPFRHPSEITTVERIATAALDLFEARGFEQVTVDDIAARAGITQRTVFRYYANKAAIIFDAVEFSYFVVLPPSAPSLHDAIRAALDEAAARIEEKREAVIRNTRLIMQSVALRAAAHELGERGMQQLRADLAGYLDSAESSARVHVLAEIIYAIGFGARHLWFDDETLSIADVMHESLDAMRRFFQSLPEPV
jgi:AcrR family transcriptional regulator